MKRWLAMIGVVVAICLSQPLPAYAHDTKQQIIETLKQTHVYVSPDIKLVKPDVAKQLRPLFLPGDDLVIAVISKNVATTDAARDKFAHDIFDGLLWLEGIVYVNFETGSHSWATISVYNHKTFDSDEIDQAFKNAWVGPDDLEQTCRNLIPQLRMVQSIQPREHTAGRRFKAWFSVHVIPKVGGAVPFYTGLAVIALAIFTSPIWLPAVARKRAPVVVRPSAVMPKAPVYRPAVARAKVVVAAQPVAWPGQPAAVLTPLTLGDPVMIGRYELISRIGEGGMGQVYLGRAGGKKVAVKLISPGILGDDKVRRRFEREIRLAEQFSQGSPYFVRVFDHDTGSSRPYLATEFVDGWNLEDLIRAKGRFNVSQVTRIAIELAQALAYMHGEKVVHRDIKPSNIMLPSRGLKVIDFGIAHALGATRLTDQGRAGTPVYMSPELINDEPVSTKSDIFSFGGVIVYLSTGRLAFDGDNFAQIYHKICYDPPNLTGVPVSLQPLARACLQRDPAQRPSATNIISRLVM